MNSVFILSYLTTKIEKSFSIISRDECAKLCKVLNHNTIKMFMIIEIDEERTEMSREHLLYWSDYSNFIRSVD